MPELSLIVPTYNEADNVAPLVEALETTLEGHDWEVIFVDDDSPDGTTDRVRELGKTRDYVRCIRRVGRRGLSSACVEGMAASRADLLAVIDADGQHDHDLLSGMLEQFREGSCDVAIGSRYTGDGSAGEGLSAIRSAGSRFANMLGRSLARQKLTDPMSGFFMLRRKVFEDSQERLYGQGFKILLDILASHPGDLRIVELPYHMRPRTMGDSKLDHGVITDYLLMIANKKVSQFMPARFLLFVSVGLVGVAVHLATLYLSHAIFGQSFPWAQGLATWVAMTGNFFLNNIFTFGDRRLRGLTSLLRGLFSFYLACSLGALINVALATYLFDLGMHWSLSGLIGAGVGAVWNFALSSWLTWRQ